MGSCLSSASAPLLEANDGGEEAYHTAFMEDQVLGQGEFGVVKMVHSLKDPSKQPFASKILRKGAVFKDNTLLFPLKPEVLRGEIEMLRTLRGQDYCLRLQAVFETPKCLYVVTEYCAGGEMTPYIANLQEELRTEDVSRIAFQMFSAVAHCHKHQILHRDIKPENWMFVDPSPGAEGRLIDFGSGTLDTEPDLTHTTYAGSGFYISPEMFQRKYTAATDVWSVGATLYVLVAGYPADQLQRAFNILQTNKNRNLRELPNMPDNLPDSFYNLLEQSLTYRHKKRPSAKALLKHEFVTFHAEPQDYLSLESIAATAAAAQLPAAAAAAAGSGSQKRTSSVALQGSVVRHNVFLGFQQYERAVTTLLAALLSKTELQQLLQVLQDKAKAAIQAAEEKKEAGDEQQQQTLSVVRVSELKTIIHDVLKNDPVIEAMDKIPRADLYDEFAYHTALLSDFNSGDWVGNAASLSASLGRRRRNSSLRGSLKRGGSLKGRASLFAGTQQMTGSNRSTSSVRSFRATSRGGSRGRNSISGTNVFANAVKDNKKSNSRDT